MNIFVENNGPYVYRSIFRKIPRLRHEQQQQQPVREECAGTETCHSCGAPLHTQDYSATTPAGLDCHPEPEPEFQFQSDPDPKPGPEPQPETQPARTNAPTVPADPAASSDPNAELESDQLPDPSAGLDPSKPVSGARVLEVFEFLFKTIDDALIDQPALLTRISRAFAEGLASAIGP